MSYNISDNSPRQERCNRPRRDISFNHETGAITEHGIAPDGCHCHGDADLEKLKRKYQALTEAAIKAREAAEAAKNAFVEKADKLDTLATGAQLDSTKVALQGNDTSATNTALKVLLNTIKTLIGQTTDTRTANSLFGKIAAVIYAVGNIDFTSIAKESTLTTIQGLIGSATDAATASTLFGKIAAVLSAVGNIDFSTIAKEANATANKREIMGASDAVATNTQGLFFPAVRYKEPNKMGGIDKTVVFETQIEIESETVDVHAVQFYITNNVGMYAGTMEVGTILTADNFNAAMEAIDAPSGFDSLIRLCSSSTGIELLGDETGQIPYYFSSMQSIPIVVGRKYRVKDIVTIPFSYPENNTTIESEIYVYVYEELSDGNSIKEVYDKLDNITIDTSNLATKDIERFFGLPEALPGSYTALTQAEVIASTRAEQVNAWGEDGCPIPNYLPAGVTEAMVEAAATALGITYYEPNFNIATL